MRHFYFRLILGLVFIAGSVYSIARADWLRALLYIALGGAFLYSACMIRKKEKDDRRR